MPNFLTAEEMNTLKAKVKTEMQRRAYNGSMTGFASASYDFSATPTSGTKVTADQGKKVVEPLLNIKDHGNLNTADLKTGSKIPSSFNYELLYYTDSLSKEPIDGATSSCRGACSGLCVGTCGNTCSGCSSCSGGCTGSGGSGGSEPGCNGCSGGCNGCYGCRGSCSGDCSDVCAGACSGGCGGGCGGTCSGCAGCGGSCSSSCTAKAKGHGCTGCATTCSSCSSCSGCGECDGCRGCNCCSSSCDGCDGCSGGCEGSCSGCYGCGSGCYGSCAGACDGCSNGCSGGCKNACATTCSATCTGTCQAQAFGAVVQGWVEDPTVDLIANGMMRPIYSKALWNQVLPGGGYANNSNYELKDLGIQIRYDKKNSEILFDLSNGLTVVDNTIFKQLGYKLAIPLFVMLNDSNITYNPNHDGSSDNYWPPTIENANGLVINAGQGYQIMVSPNETAQANKKCTRFDLIWYKYNTTKNYPEVGSIFKGSKVIRIPFKITGI